jgi:hypothetical protein
MFLIKLGKCLFNSFTPFVKCCQTYLRTKNTPLLFKELNCKYLSLYTPLLVKGEVLNLHMK